MAASSTEGSAAGAPQPGGTTLRIGTFNFGIQQGMLQKGTHQAHVLENLERIVYDSVEKGSLDLFFGNEIGGDSEGLDGASLSTQDTFSAMTAAVKGSSAKCGSNLSYIYAYGLRDDMQVQLPSDPVAMPTKPGSTKQQVVISVFKVSTSDTTFGNLIVGNLNVRGNQKGKRFKNQRVKHALQRLEAVATSCDFHPAVMILLGDTNLTVSNAEETIADLQPNEKSASWQNTWHIHTSSMALCGEVIFCKGALAKPFDIPIEASLLDLRMRDDLHDAFGIEVTMPVCYRGSSDSHPAVVTDSPEDIYNSMLQFFEARDTDNVGGQAIIHHLRSLVVKRIKLSVPVDESDSGAVQPGENRSVTTFVTAPDMATKIRDTIVTREAWLNENGYPLNMRMDCTHRAAFVHYAKMQFEQRPEQQKLLVEDLGKGDRSGKERRRNRAHSRWHSELSRRCGSIPLWEVVSFTGRFDAAYLSAMLAVTPHQRVSGASQPTEAEAEQITRQEASETRAELRYANKIRNKYFHGATLTPRQRDLLQRHDSDEVRSKANTVTRLFGHGRIHHSGGNVTDIGGNEGVSRQFLEANIEE